MVFGLSGTGVRLAAEKVFAFSGMRNSPDYVRNQRKIWENLEDAAQRVRVVFAQVDGDEKPKPQYLGAWGDL